MVLCHVLIVKLQYLIAEWIYLAENLVQATFMSIYESRRKGIVEGIPFSNVYFYRWKILFVSLFIRSFLVSIIIPCWTLIKCDEDNFADTNSRLMKQACHIFHWPLCSLAGGFLKAFQAEKILASTLAFMDPSHLNFSSPSLLAIKTDFFWC